MNEIILINEIEKFFGSSFFSEFHATDVKDNP